MAVKFIEHKGRKILLGDFKGITDQEELLKQGQDAARILKESSGEQMYLLVDFHGTAVGVDFMTKIKDEGKYILKNVPLTTALTGITGLKEILVQGYIRFTNSKLRTFSTVEEAKDYLASV